MNTPENLRYTRTDEWLLIEGEIVTIGITQYAADELGELVYVELPEVGAHLPHGAECCVIESVKAVGEIHAPFEGEVVAVNSAVTSETELINASPYEDGWLVKMRPVGELDLDATLSAQEYANYRG